MANDDWAIVVGIQRYPDLGDLGGPENDATAFYNWLVSPTGGAVPQDHVALILSSHYRPPFPSASKAEPTTQHVQQAFDALGDVAIANQDQGDGLRVGRRLYIYLSGHGCEPQVEEAVLLMANATKVRAGHHIPGKPYANWFYRAGYFDEVVLLMDCCRERYPRVPLSVPPYIDLTAPDAVDRGRRFYGFGTKWSRLSRERTMPDGKVRGVFTTALLAGLEGAASDPNGRITAASLASYLYNGMKAFLGPEDLQDPEVPKEPDLWYDHNLGDTFVLATAPVPRFPVVIHLPQDSAGKTVDILGDKFQSVVSTTAEPPVCQVDLARGKYLVQLKEDGTGKIIEVRGTGGVDVYL
ncbi:MAG: hypothetical protein ACRERE_12170 [Candidatus Entotheonellia bacterium]